MVNFKLYEDGGRTIVVFENTSKQTKTIIENMLAGAMGAVQATAIQNVEPVIIKEEPIESVQASINAAEASQMQVEQPVVTEYAQMDYEANLQPSDVVVPQAPVSYFYDVNAYIMEYGFAGFCQSYEYYKENINNLTTEEKQAMLNVILAYSERLKSTNVDMISDEELVEKIRIGSTTIFKNKVPTLLQSAGYASLEDYLSSGRKNLVDAFLYFIA